MARTDIGQYKIGGKMSVTEQQLLAGLGDSDKTYWCDDCGFITGDQLHWSCAEEWHDNGSGDLCTKNLAEIRLPDAITTRLGSIAKRLEQPTDNVEFSRLFTVDLLEGVTVE